MRAAEKLRVAGSVVHCARLAIPQATERQRIGNQIDAATVFARANLVTVYGIVSGWRRRFGLRLWIRRALYAFGGRFGIKD